MILGLEDTHLVSQLVGYNRMQLRENTRYEYLEDSAGCCWHGKQVVVSQRPAANFETGCPRIIVVFCMLLLQEKTVCVDVDSYVYAQPNQARAGASEPRLNTQDSQ